jgi:peptidoglycan/LPS O-acetylase OafA/YrhL
MKPTRWYFLVILGIAAGAAAYFITRSSYNDMPSPTLYAQISLVILAIAEGYTAAITKARLEGRPGTRPIDSIIVARLVALAKASSIVGALASGAYTGFLAWVAQINSSTAHKDVRTAAVGIAAGFLLVAAALSLEWVGRVPEEDDD